MAIRSVIKVVRRGTLQLTKRAGSDCWYARGTLFGTPVFVSTRTTVRAAARKAALDIEAEYERRQEQHYTFAEAAEAYAVDGGERKYLQPLIDRLGAKLLRDLRQEDLDAAARAIYPDVALATLHRQGYTPFSAVWNFAAKGSRRWVAPCQWDKPRKPKGTSVRSVSTRAGTRPVSYERAWQFISAMSPAAAAIMTAVFYTGMRPIELFSQVAEDIDVAGRWITLPSSKTGEPRGVPMHEVLVPLYTALVARGGVLFRTSRGLAYAVRTGGGGQLRSAISGARGRTGIRDISLYTGRHTVSTQLVVAGVHPHIKDQILGHAADDMSRHYTNVPQVPLIEAINKLPVIEEWAAAPWLHNPAMWQRRLVRGENYGRAGRPKEHF